MDIIRSWYKYMNEKRERNTPINIYPTTTTMGQIKQIQTKFRVSISTIVDVLWNTFGALTFRSYKDQYINKNHTKTSIRPTITPQLEKFIELDKSNISKIYTNLLEIYANEEEFNKMVNQYHFDKGKLKTKIGNLLAEKRDTYWNYNNIVRNQTRAIRQNKEYYRRLLAE